MFNMTHLTVGTKHAIRWVIRVLSFTEMLLGSVIDYAIAFVKRMVGGVIFKRTFAVRLNTGANVIAAFLIACLIGTWVWGVRLMLLAIAVRRFVLLFALCVTFIGLIPRAMCHVTVAYGLVVSAKVTPNRCAPVSVFDIYRDFVASGQTRESGSKK